MATCLAPCIQKIPNETPIKWLIMTVSKYICICISVQKKKMRAVNESREGLDYCNHNNKCGDFDLFVVWKIVVIFGNTQFLKSADTTNVMLGHLSCKVTLMFVRVAFDQIYIRERKKSSSGSGCELRPHCLPLGVSTCDFHLRLWLSAQQDIPERVFAWLNINSPSKQPGGGWGGVWCGGGTLRPSPGLGFLLKINQAVHSLGAEISTCAVRSHV